MRSHDALCDGYYKRGISSISVTKDIETGVMLCSGNGRIVSYKGKGLARGH